MRRRRWQEAASLCRKLLGGLAFAPKLLSRYCHAFVEHGILLRNGCWSCRVDITMARLLPVGLVISLVHQLDAFRAARPIFGRPRFPQEEHCMPLLLPPSLPPLACLATPRREANMGGHWDACNLEYGHCSPCETSVTSKYKVAGTPVSVPVKLPMFGREKKSTYTLC